MRTLGKLLAFALALVAALPAAGPDGAVLLAYTFDSTVAGIRPVEGVPGAAHLGDAVAAGDFFWSAAVAPRQDYALAVADSGLMVVRLGDAGSPGETLLPSAPAVPDLVAFNRSGGAAALYSRALASVAIITGLPGAPALARTLNVSGLPAPLISMALSDDANALLAGCSDGANGAVYRFDADGSAQAVFPSPHAAAVLFRNADAVFADDRTNTIAIVRDPAGSAQAATLAAAADGVSSPIALALNDAGLVLAAQAGGAMVLDPDGGSTPVAVSCACQVTGLDHTADRAAFRLTGASAGPLWLLDLGGGSPRVVFVPPAAAPQGQPQ